MKIGIIIETKEHEKAFNAMRFAVAAKEEGHLVKIFLISDGVEIKDIENDKFDVSSQMKTFIKNEGVFMACTSCLGVRAMKAPENYRVASMTDCIDMTVWADKVVTF